MRQRLLTLLFALIGLTSAWATDYDLWIAGTRLTSDNSIRALNVPGVTGSVYYMPSSNTLNLSSAMILPTTSSVLPIYAKSGVSGLKIDVSGVCTIRSGGNIAMLFDNLDNVHITGSGTLIVEAETYDIFFRGSYLCIEDGVSVYLIGGGIDNDGNDDDQLVVDSANLFVRRNNPSLSPIYMHELVLRNAHLESPAWSTYEWSGAELSNGSQWWHGDINIKAGEFPDDLVTSAGNPYADTSVITRGDVNGDGNVTLADVTRLVNTILDGGEWHDYVDLGLPSGTLWATCNVGAENREDYGDYFAWGETVPFGGTDESNATNYNYANTYNKTYYEWCTYKWCNGTSNTLTKYCNESNRGYNGFTDNKMEMELEDDPAYVNWGPNWRTPSKEQFDELFYNYNTSIEWKTVNEVEGLKITSKRPGYTDRSIFLPAVGFLNYGYKYDQGSVGYYWARTLEYSRFGNTLVIGSGGGGKASTSGYERERSYGMPIRPVRVQ